MCVSPSVAKNNVMMYVSLHNTLELVYENGECTRMHHFEMKKKFSVMSYRPRFFKMAPIESETYFWLCF